MSTEPVQPERHRAYRDAICPNCWAVIDLDVEPEATKVVCPRCGYESTYPKAALVQSIDRMKPPK